jgi:hypothetical protein
MHEPLQATLHDAVDFLKKAGIPYALIGGLAVSVRGQPRVTADVDMVILADVPQSLRLLSSLHATAFKPLFDGAAEVVEKAFILPLRHRITNVKLDLALGLSGFEQQAIARAGLMDFGGYPVAVASSEDLLIMKILAGRPQDDQDVRGLITAQGEQLDWDYCLRVAGALGEALDQDLVGRVSKLRDA